MKQAKFKTLQKIFSIALCLALVMSYVPAISIRASASVADITVTIDTGASVTLKDTDGDNYYEIGTADELYAFAVAVNGGNNAINGELTADIVVNENVLNADGSLNGAPERVWSCIGYKNSDSDYINYTGTFNGNNFTVSGLYCSSSVGFVGFFGRLGENARLEKLTLRDSYFYGTECVGGIAGYAKETVSIVDCSNYATVKSEAEAGGILGYSAATSLTITNCENHGNISTAKSYAAGIVGYLGLTGVITYCHNSGALKGDGYIGGITGYMADGTIENCYNTFSASSKIGFNRIGGICGRQENGLINKCYNTGNLITSSVVGGIVGVSDSGEVSNCYNTGNIDSTGYDVGGICGAGRNIKNCFNTGTVRGYTQTIGGIVGDSYSITPVNCFYVSGCAMDTYGNVQYGEGNRDINTQTPDTEGCTTGVTIQQITSGEVAYLLSQGDTEKIWGQDLDNTKPVQSHPTLTGSKVYKTTGGVYTNLITPEKNSEDYYELDCFEDLIWFSNNINNGNISRNANAVLTADIDMTGVEWTPICSTDLYYLADPDAHNGDWGYTGTFDGNGYSIKNLSVTGSETADASFGVFGTLSGTVKNLGVVNFTYVGAGMDSRVGAIAGQVLKDGLITDCYLENGNIDTQINTENGVAGGIAGSNYAGTIQNCYVHAFTVKAGRAGGIVGDNYGDANNEDGTDRPGTITNCYTSTGGICNRGTSTNSLANVSDNLYASGEIVCRLNNGTSEGVWKQNGTLPDFEGDTIYRNTCGGDVYYNTKNIDYEAHNINGLVCENCGCYDAANLVTSDNYEALGLTSDFAGFYAIESASNLYWFAQQVNNGNRTVNAKLVNDIDLGNHQWIPIGLSNIKFSGTFDGNGKAITGFNINTVSSGAYGLFGYIQNATVRNFYIDGSVTVNVPEGSEIHVGVIGSSYTSGNQYTYIQNITSDVDVTVHDSYMKNTVAGIVGVISADRGSGNWGRTYIQQCTFSGNIDLGNATVDCGGGIAGYVNYNISVRIQNCLYSGTYSGESGQVGGIAGYYNGDNVWLTNCLSIGQINLTNTRFIGALGGRYINLNNDSVDSRIVNNYYLTGTLPSFSDNAEATNDVVDLGLFDGGNAQGVTSEQLASGEIAYRLGSSWGQNSNTGGSHPIVTINSLYKVAKVGETGNYSVANIGDTNADGTVDINDYQGLVNVILADDHEQIDAASYNDIIRYDLDGDGCLDVIDASLMHNFINGFITVDVYAVGDYDCNGKAFEDADIKAVKHALENPEKLSTAEKYACDITGDGKVDESDLAKLNALYGESETVKCEDNLKVYYTYKNNYKTCTATAICTLCNKTVVTETVKTTSETLSELTCTQDGEYKYTANFTNELFGTKINEVTVITKGHNFVDRKCTECSAVAEITGVAIIIDGVEYNKDSGTSESNPAIIKPDSTVKFKVYGTNLNYATDENCFFKDYGTYLTLDRADSLKFVYNETNTELTIDYHIDYFQRNTNVVELQFGNNGANGELLSGGVWYAYPPEQVVDANITGVALIVDGVEYNEGLVTVRAESRVVVKVYGTNLSENGVTNGDFVLYGEIFGANLNNGRWTFNEDGLSATYEEIAGNMYIGYVEPYTILYCNDVYGNWVSSGLSVIYVAE